MEKMEKTEWAKTEGWTIKDAQEAGNEIGFDLSEDDARKLLDSLEERLIEAYKEVTWEIIQNEIEEAE